MRWSILAAAGVRSGPFSARRDGPHRSPSWSLAALGAGLLLAGCTPADEPEPTTTAQARPVRVAAPVWSERALPVRASGVVARRTEADLAFKVGGILASVDVRVGDAVTAGQRLARLETEEFDARLVQARSAAEKAERDLARIQRLETDRVSTLEELQAVRTAAEIAEAQVRIAEYNRRHAEIVAPADGRILRRLAEPGEPAGPGQAIVGFATGRDGWLVRVGLPAREARRIARGDRVEVRAGELTLEGEVAQISEAAEPGTRTVPVEIALVGDPAGLRSGEVVSVSIQPPPVPVRPVVPASALIEGSGLNASLFVLEAEAPVARRLMVELEALDGANAYLRTALPPTARVVVQGGEFLEDGVRVEIVP